MEKVLKPRDVFWMLFMAFCFMLLGSKDSSDCFNASHVLMILLGGSVGVFISGLVDYFRRE